MIAEVKPTEMIDHTMWAAILYFSVLFPGYGIISMICDYKSDNTNKATQELRFKWWILGIILSLQLATIITSPADCYRFLQGDRCQSKLNILMKRARPPSGEIVPHWTLVEDYLFPGFLVSYLTVLTVAVAVQPCSTLGKNAESKKSSNS
jgi:hypothetical protein